MFIVLNGFLVLYCPLAFNTHVLQQKNCKDHYKIAVCFIKVQVDTVNHEPGIVR